MHFLTHFYTITMKVINNNILYYLMISINKIKTLLNNLSLKKKVLKLLEIKK